MTVKIFQAFILISMLLSSCSGSPTIPAQTESAIPTMTTPGSIITNATQMQTAMFEEAPCPFELPPDQVEGKTVECGYLTEQAPPQISQCFLCKLLL
jgi:hypothetical protein